VIAEHCLEVLRARPGLDLAHVACYAHDRARPLFRDMTEDDFDPVISALDAVLTASRCLKRERESRAEKS